MSDDQWRDRVEATLDRLSMTVDKIETEVRRLLMAAERREAIEAEREPLRQVIVGLPARVDTLERAVDQDVSGIHARPVPAPTTVETPPPEPRPAIVQVMDHPHFQATLRTVGLVVIATAMAVAGTLTWADVQERVPSITLEDHISTPPPVGPAPLP